ncbi:MAG: hypothetical protein V4547_18130 [Bacteroidota bacterium]
MLTDESLMPWGIYKGKLKMANVPAEYLLYLYEENKMSGDVLAYVKDNLEVLKQEIKDKPKGLPVKNW